MLTLYLLLNAMIGSGILAQAYVFSKAGVINTIVEYVLIGYLTYTGVEMLILSADKINVITYPDLCEKSLGSYGKYLIEYAILFSNAGALMSYIIIVGTLLDSILLTYISSSWYTNSAFLVLISVLLIIFPICLIRNFGHLSYISVVSIMAIGSVVLLVTVGGPLVSNEKDSNMLMSDSIGMFETIGSVIFAFGYATVIFPCYYALDSRTPKKFNSIAVHATSIGIVMCFAIGIMGYYCYGSDTKADILENFTGVLGTIFKLIVIIHLILYIPGDYVIMRASFMNLLGKDARFDDNASYLFITISTLGLITIISCLLLTYESSSDSLAIVLELTGGIGGSIVNFIVPGLVASHVLWDDGTAMKIKVVSLLAFGLAFPFLSIVSVCLEY